MELTEEQIEKQAIKRVFKQYRENAAALKQSLQEKPAGGYQLGFDFGSIAPSLVPDYTLQLRDAKAYNDTVTACVKRLSAAERTIIMRSYMSDDRIPPWRVYERELHVGRTLYFTLKSKAIGKLYVMFRLQRLVK